MRLGYYGYYLTRGDQKYQYNILPILKNFSHIRRCDFSKIVINDLEEEVFLKDLGQNCFMLILTKDMEIIKAINSETGDAADIYEKIETNNRLGFASYIKFHESAFGYAICSTTGGPKNRILADAINMILTKIQPGLNNPVMFYPVAVTESSTREEIRTLPFVGTMLIEANSRSSLGQMLRRSLGLGDNTNIDSFEVRIKPKKRESLNLQAFQSFLDTIALDGIKKYIIKGKRELDELLSEFYLVTEGQIGDEIKKSDEASILAEMRRKFEQRNNYFTSLLNTAWTHHAFSNNINELGGLLNYEHEVYWQQHLN